jgi:hypothetical protein
LARAEHRLRAVDEVSVLRFPYDQAVGRLNAVAVFKANRGVFAERAVVNFKRGAGLRQVLQGHKPTAGVGIREHGMPVAEGATADVFSGQPNWRAILEDRRHGQLLGHRPVDGARAAVGKPVAAFFPNPLELAMHDKPVRDIEE